MSWAATTLVMGQAATRYRIKRYDAETAARRRSSLTAPGRPVQPRVASSKGETLVYRLDNPSTGMTGNPAGHPTPATFPAGREAAVAVRMPANSSDRAHTIYAVTSPSGETAATGIVVDGTASRQQASIDPYVEPDEDDFWLNPGRAAVSPDRRTVGAHSVSGSVTSLS